MEIQTSYEIDNILDKLDEMEPKDRLAALEGGLEDMINRFRDRINKEALVRLNKKTSENAAVVCKDGHSFKIIKSKKKTFF